MPGVSTTHQPWFVHSCDCVYRTTPNVCVSSTDDGSLGFQFEDFMSKAAEGLLDLSYGKCMNDEY